MEPIKPKQYLDDEHVADFRSATEHRATWMYLLVDEARKRGLDPEFARDAIYRCGCFHRSQKPETDSLRDYCESVFHQIGRKVFEQEVDITEEQATVVFHYCPLVAAWQKQTDDPEYIKLLCDMAMDGDRGMFSDPSLEFHLDQTIAGGCDSCIVRVTPKR